MKQPEFDAFYRRTKDTCFRAVLASVGNTAEADDLLAEAYTRAWQRWDVVRNHPAPEAWIVLVAMNLHRDNWRSNRFWSRLRPANNVPAPELDLDIDLLKALRQLPDRQREVVVLRVLLDHEMDVRQPQWPEHPSSRPLRYLRSPRLQPPHLPGRLRRRRSTHPTLHISIRYAEQPAQTSSSLAQMEVVQVARHQVSRLAEVM